ncbi:MAG: hypothetical protein H6842_05240 [Rhodospirillaceae bacterium]|nr:hypothetical protein [Rhodospirillaceae bacterium]
MLIWMLPIVPLLVVAGGVSAFLAASQPIFTPSGTAGGGGQAEMPAGIGDGEHPEPELPMTPDPRHR